MAAKVTMQDIADRLNISKSLVSRALADKYGVSDGMRTKIRLTAVEMGYQMTKNTHVKSRAMSNHTISVLVRRDVFNDIAFYKEMLNGIEQAVREKNMLLSLIIVEENDATIINTRNIRSDGIVVLGLMSTENIAAVMAMGKAIVLLDTFDPHYRVDRISSNNFDGCYSATDYVIRRGHRHICFVGDLSYSFSFLNRRNGFKARVAECTEPIRVTEVLEPRANEQEPFCIPQLRQVLSATDRPTALVCANDTIAEQAYVILADMHLSIPKDVSVIGFDNNRKAQTMQPALTTLSVPRVAMGRLAVERLWKQISERIAGCHHAVEYTQVDVDLIERDSVVEPSTASFIDHRHESTHPVLRSFG